MAAKATSTQGVKLRSLIVDSRTKEVVAVRRGSQGVSQVVEVRWTFAARPGDVRVTSTVVQNPSVADYGSGSPWPALFTSVRRVPRSLSEPLTVSPKSIGQVIIDCGLVEVWDIWSGQWIPESLSAQLTLAVT